MGRVRPHLKVVDAEDVTTGRGGSTFPIAEIFGPTFQGEGPYAGRMASFVRFGWCNLSCEWCMVPGTRILRPDYTWTAVEALDVGDTVLGRTAPAGARHGRITATTVTAVRRREARLVRVNDELVCAADTRFWLTGRKGEAHSGWRNIERCAGLHATYLASPPKRDVTDYQRGYVAGVADGDGCFWSLGVQGRTSHPRRFRLAMNDTAILERFRRYAEEASFTLRWGSHGHTGFKGRGVLNCLWLTRRAEAERFEAWCAQSLPSESWAWGYLAGMVDAEGSLVANNIIRISQAPGTATYHRVLQVARSLQFDVAEERKGIRLRARGGGLWRFVVNATPVKTYQLRDRAPNHGRVITSVEPAGCGEVVSLTTTTGNYVADGWLVHNCDQPETWDRSRFDLAITCPPASVEQIIERAAATKPEPVPRLLVLTGGEPLLHQRSAAWRDLLTALRGSRFLVHVETNGTIVPSRDTVESVDFFVVSPKLTTRDPERRRLRATPLASYVDLVSRGRGCFKFVAATAAEVHEVAAWVAERTVDPNDVWISPQATTATEQIAVLRRLADACLGHGFHLTPRVHTLIWDEERGR